ELPMRIKGLGLRPGNVVRLSLKKMGYVNKLFRVVRWNFNLFGGPDLVLEGYEDAIYTWSSLDAVVVGATPDTTLPNPCIIATPAMPTLSSGTPELMELGDGTVISRMRVAWPNPTDAYVRRAEVRYRVAGDTEWQAGPPVPDASTGFVHLNPVIDGAGYEVQLRFENSLGVRSAWSDTSIHLVVGKREKPADVPWFLINGNDLTWGTVAGADIAGYRLRWQPDNLLSWGDANPLLIDDGLVLASPYTMIARPAGPVTLLIKAIDDSGNESVKPAAIVTDLGDPLVLNILASRDERALGWPGTLSGGAVDGVSGDILASHDASPAMWSNDAAAMWTHDWEPMWAPATYAALEYIVVLPQLVATDVGGGITVVADVVGSPWSLEYRRIGAEPMWTNDAAPMWTGDADAMWSPAEAWKPWPGRVVAETVAYEFRIRCAAGDVQGRIAALYVNIDVPDVTERLDDVVIAAGGTRLPITKSYRVIKNVGLTLQADGGTARGTRLEDKNATLGPLVICLDGAGVSVAGLVDVNQIQGY
ncbi:MAG: hypothetical protein Q7U97_03720, partial [Rhodocyclaceae bacterium]|nr:hypothetical protein [Rhodocyclaceae bacterium]